MKSSQTSPDTNKATPSARDSGINWRIKISTGNINVSVEFTIWGDHHTTEKQELLQKIEALAQSVPVPGKNETVIATKTTDVGGRLTASVQETKELELEIKSLCEERTAIKEQLDAFNSITVILQNEKNQLEVNITESKNRRSSLCAVGW